MISIDVADTISKMIIQEKNILSKDCYTLKKINATNSVSQFIITTSLGKDVMLHDEMIEDVSYFRFCACEWMCELINYYAHKLEIMTIAMSFFDRYSFIIKDFHDRVDIDLVALVALYLAVKINSPKGRCVLRDFGSLSGGRYSEDDIALGESKLLFALSWSVYTPTPQAFTRYLLRSHPDSIYPEQWEIILRVSHVIIEISLFQEELVSEKASDIACASIFIAIDGVSSAESMNQLCSIFTNRLERVHKVIPESISLVRNQIESIMSRSSLSVHTIQVISQSTNRRRHEIASV